jgi:hypothetical protein
MVRPFATFLVVFSILSFLVHLDVLASVFGIGALCLFAVEVLISQFGKTPRASKMRREPLL